MPRALPSLELIRGFEAAARLSSFTRAAEELFITQSAVSRQVQALEEHLGTALFERHHRAIRLTHAGELLYRAASQALLLLTDTAARIRQEGAHRSVTVSCTFGFASLWLVPRLMDFRERHPDVDVRIAANNKIVDIERERMEVAVRYCTADMVPPGTPRLFGEEVFPVCSPALLERRGKPLRSPLDLQRHVLLHHEGADQHWPTGSWSAWLEAVQLPNLEPAGALRFDQYDQLIQAAIEGQGVALGIGALVKRHLRQGRLVAPFEQKSSSPRGYYLVVARHASSRAEVAAFRTWLMRAARRDAQS
jgi:LysR family transcriptional regulator, glycine cleavage system transcriptional activator